MRTYWINYPRDFANEYTVAVATTTLWAKRYEDEEWTRISRRKALRRMAYRGDAATQAFVGVEQDGRDVCDSIYGLREYIRSIARPATR